MAVALQESVLEALTAWLPFAALVVSLAAVIVGPTIQSSIAKRQIEASQERAELSFRATVLSGNRQVWINELRGLVSEFVSRGANIAMKWYHALVAPGSSGVIEADEMAEQLAELHRLECRIALMLNPEEPESSELLEAVRAMIAALNSKALKQGTKGVEDAARAVVDRTQPILKGEWERVKRAE